MYTSEINIIGTNENNIIGGDENNIITKLKNLFSKIPIIYYGIFFIIIMIIYFYTTGGLTLYNKITKIKDQVMEDDVLFKNEVVRFKYKKLLLLLGEPSLVETHKSFYTESVTWKDELDNENFKYGKYNGLDYIRLNGYVARKNHPIPAPVYIIVGKYINVPEHLYGPLKYASPTINIEQIYIPKKHNLHYEKTGIKKVSLVTGSCASITISAITIKFVEDMIEEYKNNQTISMDLNTRFRKEYNLRVLTYLCGKGITPSIPWYSADNFNEEEKYNSGSDKCKIFKSEKQEDDSITDGDKVNKIIDSIDNSISRNYLTKDDIKNLLKPKHTENENKNETEEQSETEGIQSETEGIQNGGSDKKKTRKKKNKKKDKKCDAYETADNCNNDSDCIWDNGCSKKICHNASDKESCESDEIYATKCYWDNLDELNKCKHRPS